MGVSEGSMNVLFESIRTIMHNCPFIVWFIVMFHAIKIWQISQCSVCNLVDGSAFLILTDAPWRFWLPGTWYLTNQFTYFKFKNAFSSNVTSSSCNLYHAESSKHDIKVMKITPSMISGQKIIYLRTTRGIQYLCGGATAENCDKKSKSARPILITAH